MKFGFLNKTRALTTLEVLQIAVVSAAVGAGLTLLSSTVGVLLVIGGGLVIFGEVYTTIKGDAE